MSIDALWSVAFESNVQAVKKPAGEGVVVLQAGRLLGGDSGYLYEGHYTASTQTGQFEARIHVRKHGTLGMPSVLGSLENCHLILSGQLSSTYDSMRMKGHVQESPNVKISIIAKRQAELT